MTWRVSLDCRVTDVKVLIWAIVPADAALNNAAFTMAVWVADDVKVFCIVVLFVPLECVLVVASALPSPPVVISPVRAVSVAAGEAEFDVRPI